MRSWLTISQPGPRSQAAAAAAEAAAAGQASGSRQASTGLYVLYIIIIYINGCYLISYMLYTILLMLL